MRRTLVFDIEVYKNYWLIVFKDIKTGEFWSWEMAWDEKLEGRERLRKFVRKHLIIGFNSRNFDIPVLFGALAGLDCATLKDIAEDIIVGKMKPWDIEDRYKFTIPRKLHELDHIDLIEVAPGQASLKIYNGRLHGKRMQDLPIEPSAILTPRQMDDIYDYCCNDLAATELLWHSLAQQIDLRIQMSKEYGEDLRSKSDAQVAEAVIKSQVADILGKAVKAPTVAAGASYTYNVPDFIRFKSDDLNDALDLIEETKFRLGKSGNIEMPEALSGLAIKIGKGVYRMGIGGLHSSEESTAHVAENGYRLIDRDVASYYPAIIINQNLYPSHMGAAFQKVYRRIVDRRLKAKEEAKKLEGEIEQIKASIAASNRDGPSLMSEKLEQLTAAMSQAKVTADSLKITINGSFGKFGNKWSALYSPQLLIQTTITGQLSLLMLIERLERAGIEVVSANTDGIVIKVHEDDDDLLDEIVAKWEKATGFQTEATEYEALYSRDVNNYIAVKKGGKAKRKGAFAEVGMMKNPANEIATDAVVAFLTKGVPLHKTIRACKDITKFVTVRTVKGGALAGMTETLVDDWVEVRDRMWMRQAWLDGDSEDEMTPVKRKSRPRPVPVSSGGEYLGKAIRWYYSAEVEGAIHYKGANKSGNHNKVPRSDGARPLMELPDEFPDDIDYQRYVKDAREILEDIGHSRSLV